MERIPNERLIEIAGLAGELWFGFLEAFEGQLKATDLFSSSIARINPVVLKFFQYCSEIEIGELPAIGGSTQSVIQSFVLATALTGKHSAPTWLWCSSNGAPGLLIDYDQIDVAFPQRPVAQKVITRLFLHEIGHLVLHFKRLTTGSSGRVHNSTSLDEEEAWAFCGIILGLALGTIARGGRDTHPKDQVDKAWKHSI